MKGEDTLFTSSSGIIDTRTPRLKDGQGEAVMRGIEAMRGAAMPIYSGSACRKPEEQTKIIMRRRCNGKVLWNRF